MQFPSVPSTPKASGQFDFSAARPDGLALQEEENHMQHDPVR
jgi:hypothetical protein